MSTITPTSDSTQYNVVTSFAQGDLVISLDTGLQGTVMQADFNGDPTQVYVSWTPFNSGAVSVFRLSRA